MHLWGGSRGSGRDKASFVSDSMGPWLGLYTMIYCVLSYTINAHHMYQWYFCQLLSGHYFSGFFTPSGVYDVKSSFMLF
jgi:hypothetical protein